jgi:hypothetical protein
MDADMNTPDLTIIPTLELIEGQYHWVYRFPEITHFAIFMLREINQCN